MNLLSKFTEWIYSRNLLSESVDAVDAECSRCWCKKLLYPHTVDTVDAVGTQYAVGVGTKRSTHTVDLADMGGGDHYL